MAQTQPYKKQTFAGSVAAGLGSIFKANGKKYYILEHKITSKYHKAGEWQEIIVDNIELGRSSKCQVQFDEGFTTVSSRHAAIIKEGDNWKLVQLSKTNSTLLNGQKVEKEWYLQNGDEIQLSVNGPKLGFIIPTGAKSTVGTIGLTRRLSLFRQQALKPYKTAITVLSAVLVLSLCGSVAYNIYQKKIIDDLVAKIEVMKDINAEQDATINKLLDQNKEYARQLEESQSKLIELGKVYDALQKKYNNAISQIRNMKKMIAAPDEIAKQCSPFTYAIYQVNQTIYTSKGKKFSENKDAYFVGTGFMLNNGKFITARHVLEDYYYYDCYSDAVQKSLAYLNALHTMGFKIVNTFVAISPNGESLKFTTDDFNYDRSTDYVSGYYNADGRKIVLYSPKSFSTDWASMNVSKSGMPFSKGNAVKLQAGTKLHVLGFPHGRGAENPEKVSTVYSDCKVARNGLDTDGTIMVSNDDTQPGNSGGPVIVDDGGKYVVIGILSGSTWGKGRLTPVSAIK